jgi:F-type H+-transporting ATPase subunit a
MVKFFCTLAVWLSFALGSNAQTPIEDSINDPHATAEHHAEGQGEHTTGSEKKGIDIKELLFEHVGDTHDWHLFDFAKHPISVPLPVIIYKPSQGVDVFMSSAFEHGHKEYKGYKLDREASKGIKEEVLAVDGSKIYDFSITKNVLSMFISMIILLGVMFAVAKRSKRNGTTKAPTGIQNAIEPIITFIRENVAKPFLGKDYAKYMPLLLTFFFFIWINNLLGLLPFGFNLTGNIAFTAFLTLVFFVVMLFKSKSYFWGHIFNPPGVPLGVKFLLVPIEFLSVFIKPVALCLRLFANIFAGHTIILCIVSLIFIFVQKFGMGGAAFSLVSLPFTVFMFFIELLVAAIQAFIFTNLAAVFIGQAIEEHHHDDAHSPATAAH